MEREVINKAGMFRWIWPLKIVVHKWGYPNNIKGEPFTIHVEEVQVIVRRRVTKNRMCIELKESDAYWPVVLDEIKEDFPKKQSFEISIKKSMDFQSLVFDEREMDSLLGKSRKARLVIERFQIIWLNKKLRRKLNWLNYKSKWFIINKVVVV